MCRGRHPHDEERGHHIAEHLPAPHDQVIGKGGARPLPPAAVGFKLAKYPTNHGVEKEPTESEEPRKSGEGSGEVDPPGLP
jgi:hypothetical protein